MNKDDGNLVRILIGVALCASLIGCSQAGRDEDELQVFVQKKPSPVAGIPYRVLPPDVIGISSKYVREIHGIQRRVRPDGKIALPLIGEVFVAGKTLQEIGYEIAWAARRYYKRATVTVYMAGYNSQKIHVFGQVSRPGSLPWTGSDTLLDVLAKVQPTLLAWPERIKIIRARTPRRGGYLPYTEQAQDPTNETKEMTIDLMAMVKKGDMSRNIFLWPDDVIYVPPNPSAKVGLAIRQLLYPVHPVIETLRLPVSYLEATDIDGSYHNERYGTTSR